MAEFGRRKGLKIPRWKHRAGSSPAPGTILDYRNIGARLAARQANNPTRRRYNFPSHVTVIPSSRDSPMPTKNFISAQELLEDSYRLGALIIERGFRPDFIVGIWRGGAPVGIAVQEMLEYFGVTTDHISVRTSLYAGINKADSQVRVHGLGYLTKNLNAENALLIVDDVYDSGRSIQAVIEQLVETTRRNTPAQIKVATPWYKPDNNQTEREPDFYLHTTDQWLVFPHEVQGMSEQEIARNKPEIHKIMQSIIK